MLMSKQTIAFIIFFAGLLTSYSQAYEVGLSIGAGNYIGDIGRETYFFPNKIGGSFVFKQTINPWFSYRFNANYNPLEAHDSESSSLGRRVRNFSVKGDIWSISAGIEYNFIPRNPYDPVKSIHKVTPYIYTGIGLGSVGGTFYNDAGANKYSDTKPNIPVKLGVKYRAARHFIISLESGVSYYFSDNLDGTGSFYCDQDNLIRYSVPATTNINSNDWYSFTSISFIYTFGDLSCYFNM
jgi:hypothetical protein